MASLTDTKVRTAKPKDKPYKLQDGQGLYLDVRPSGVKVWRYRYWWSADRDGIFTIGEYPGTTLSEARKEREWARKQVKAGINPTHAKEAERARKMGEGADTFEAVAKEWIEEWGKDWTDGYRSQVEDTLAADVYPKIGSTPIRMVTAAQLLGIVKAVVKREAKSVAVLIRQWFGQIFRYAIANQRADGDPSTALRGSIKRGPVRHNPPLSEDEIPRFMVRLAEYGGYRPTKIAIYLLLYTFVRTIEMRKAERPEFNLAGAEWRIPLEHLKMRKKMLPGEVHIVPLSRQVVALLKELDTITGSQPRLFPNVRDPKKLMSATTINNALKNMGYGGVFSGHGFRSTASTMLHELGWDDAVIDRQLAHAERNKVKAAYNHAEHLKERRKMMQAWADHIDALAKQALKKGKAL